MAGDVKFVVDDEQSLEEAALPRSISEAIKILDGLELGKLLTRPRLAELVDCSEGTFARKMVHPALAEYKEVISLHGTRKYLFGSKDTIAAFRKWNVERRKV